MTDLVRQARELGGFSPETELCSLMADEIERLRAVLRNVSKSKCEICCQYGRLHDIARAALGDGEND